MKIIFLLTGGFSCWVLWLFLLLPLPADFFFETESTRFLSRNGEMLGEVFSEQEEKKYVLPLSQVSSHFLAAVIAAEDKNFLTHSGVDVMATLRAIRDNLLFGRVVSGASTISQQVARNYFGSRERTIGHKIQETLFALKLERQLGKSEILEKWVNRVSFGGNRVGIESAAQAIFGKSAEHLDLAEAALLAGIPQSPERFDPRTHFSAAKKKQEFVLDQMRQAGFISVSQEENARNEELLLAEQDVPSPAPHFLTWLQSTAEFSKLQAEKNRKIITTLDDMLQKNINELVKTHLQRLSAHHIRNAAVLVWDVQSGEILAFVGNTDFDNKSAQGEVNMLMSGRAVGSTLKPFLYLLAFQTFDWNADTIVYDEPSGFGTETGFFYEPQNYDVEFRGKITIREALGESRNVPAVKTLRAVGEKEFLLLLERFGIPTELANQNDFGLSAALGSFDIRPWELAHAYGILARGGRDFEFRFLLPERKKQEASLADCKQVFEIVDILSDRQARIDAFGTKNPLNFPYAVAAKTGTTRNFRDNWTVGFSDQVGVLVWTGNADGSPMRDVSGITGAAPLFAAVMNEAMKDRPKAQEFSWEKMCGPETKNEEFQAQNEEEKNTTFPESFRILTPLKGQTFRISAERPLDSQKLEFSASEEAEWSVNGERVGFGKRVLWIPKPGKVEIVARDGEGKEERRSIKLTIY